MNNINACFISYRHPGDPEADKYVIKFKEVLAKHLSLWQPGAKIFLDQHRLGVGDFFNPMLAQELCRSACMVMLYSPCHFESTHPYCALEYHAMLDLEARRLPGVDPLQNRGLIFPVVLRGFDCLPDEIRSRRHCVDFERDVVRQQDFTKRKCEEEIKNLAKRIYDCFRHLNNAGAFAAGDCCQFQFPDIATVKPWLDTVSPISHFPGH